jgi:hypothetical protein
MQNILNTSDKRTAFANILNEINNMEGSIFDDIINFDNYRDYAIGFNETTKNLYVILNNDITLFVDVDEDNSLVKYMWRDYDSVGPKEHFEDSYEKMIETRDRILKHNKIIIKRICERCGNIDQECVIHPFGFIQFCPMCITDEKGEPQCPYETDEDAEYYCEECNEIWKKTIDQFWRIKKNENSDECSCGECV